MNDEHFQGWSNYETWLVSLWLDNDEQTSTYWREQATVQAREAPGCGQVCQGIWTSKQAAKYNLADQLKEEIVEGSPLDEASVYSDLLAAALGEVNWSEIAETMLAEVSAAGD